MLRGAARAAPGTIQVVDQNTLTNGTGDDEVIRTETLPLQSDATIDVAASVNENGAVVPGSRNANRARIRMVQVSLRMRSSQTDKTGKPLGFDLTSTFYTPNLVIKERPSGNSL